MEKNIETKKKPVYKTLLFWEIVIVSAVLLALVIGILIALRQPLKQPEPSETTEETEETGDTLPTLPPPPANPYDRMDFYYENGYLTCDAGESTLGIDVSVWQKEIDWQAVREAGVEFAMIRAAWRGSEQGILTVDEMAQKNYEGARAAGIKVGAYLFSQAITPEEAVEEAEYILEVVKDWELEMPIVFDWEYIDSTSRTGAMDPRTLTDCTLAFCRRIEQAGFRPMIYFNKNQSHQQMYLEELTDYDFWLALYGMMDYPYRVDMWQYTNTGSVPGIEGNVDINLQLHYEN